jgi:hypothetical protein
MKTALTILSLAALASCGPAVANGAAASAAKSDASHAHPDCPTAPLRGLAGTFRGVLLAVDFQGAAQPQQNLTETQAITSCEGFEFDIRYSDPTSGAETRQVAFSAAWDGTSQAFVLTGPVIHGVLRAIRPGQFVASFETAFAGNPAHCEEMMTLTDGDRQLTRSVQCAAGGLDGASLGVRTALASRVP